MPGRMPRRVSPATDPPRSGLLFLVTAPSGAGKDSVIGVLRDRGADLSFAITALTREPREGERDGIDHFFLSDGEFEQRLANGWFLETARVYGRRTAPPSTRFASRCWRGETWCSASLSRARVSSSAAIRAPLRSSCSRPLRKRAERRMRIRATESPQEIERRIAAMREYELSFAEEADFRVVNTTGDLERAADRVREIVRSVRRTPKRRAVAADLRPVLPPD